MKRYKQFIIGFLVGAMLFSTIGVFAEGFTILPNPFPILINGIKAEVEAYNINGRTFLALGDTAKYLGATAKLNEVTKEIEVTTNTEGVKSMSVTLSSPEQIEYDPVTGLPLGAEYIENEKNGKTYNTLLYNEKIYISEIELRRIYHIEYTAKKTFANQDNKKYVVLDVGTDSFSVKGRMYYEIGLFSELIGE